jgi:hypothetical protein
MLNVDVFWRPPLISVHDEILGILFPLHFFWSYLLNVQLSLFGGEFWISRPITPPQ